MTKSDLKCGYLVRIADGRLLLLVQLNGEVGLFDKNNSWIVTLEEYNYNMKYIEDKWNLYDIVEVYGYLCDGGLFDINNRKLLWSRKDEMDTKEYEIDSQIHMIDIMPNSKTYKACENEYLTAVEMTNHYDKSDFMTAGLSIDNMKDMIKAFTEIIDYMEGNK